MNNNATASFKRNRAKWKHEVYMGYVMYLYLRAGILTNNFESIMTQMNSTHDIYLEDFVTLHRIIL